MAGQTDAGTKCLFSSAARGGRLGHLGWGMLLLGLWGLLALSLVRAVVVPSPVASTSRQATEVSAPAAQQATLFIAGGGDLDRAMLQGQPDCVPCELCLSALPRRVGNSQGAARAE